MSDSAQFPQDNSVVSVPPATSPTKSGGVIFNHLRTAFVAPSSLPVVPQQEPTSVPVQDQIAVSVAPISPQKNITDTPAENEIAELNTENSLASAVPLAVESLAEENLNPTHVLGGGGAKEVRPVGVTLERPAMDLPGGMQHVEQHERGAEIPVEVESFIEQVVDHHNQIPQEIVVTDQAGTHPTTPYLAQPVIVLPITQEMEKEGAKKSPLLSIRWLVEWSRKMMKMFSGRVVYSSVPTSASSQVAK